MSRRQRLGVSAWFAWAASERAKVAGRVESRGGVRARDAIGVERRAGAKVGVQREK